MVKVNASSVQHPASPGQEDGVTSAMRLLSLLEDPVARRWMRDRILGRWRTEPPPPHPAPIVPSPDMIQAQCARSGFGGGHKPLPRPRPGAPLRLCLPGYTLDIIQGEDGVATSVPWNDPLQHSAMHSFAWLTGEDGPALLALLWPDWLDRHEQPDSSPVWSPRMTALRAVALLDIARNSGLPEPRSRTLAVLAAHIGRLCAALGKPMPPALNLDRAILAHALARLGLDLGAPAAADLGLALLIEEAERLCAPSGMSLMESSCHHLDLTRLCTDGWLAAQRMSRAEARPLEGLAHRFLGALHALTLPGGLPLVGNILPLSPEGWLNGLLRGADPAQGWTGLLALKDRDRLLSLRDSASLADLTALERDGWLRQDMGAWSGLWHTPPSGWTHQTGEGHRDISAFVLHYDGIPVFTDLGGAPSSALNGGPDVLLAAQHGGLMLGDQPPYPADHAGYSDAFRREIGGEAPRLRAEYDGASLAMTGFNRLGGPCETERRWCFGAERLTIEDRIGGTGRFRVTRRLITPLAVISDETGLILEGPGQRFRLSSPDTARLSACAIHPGFGAARPATQIEWTTRINLPWCSTLTLERLSP